MRRTATALLCLLPLASAWAEDAPADAPAFHLAQFGDGAGPTHETGVFHLLDAQRTPRQANAVAFDRPLEGAREHATLTCHMRVLEGGDGGAFLFLATGSFGVRGPAPYLANWVEPNLKDTFAVGVDVHNPPSEEMFTPWGNYQDLPQRELSLHWDGREIVKRVAPVEFRGEEVEVEIALVFVTGGAEATVRIGASAIYDRLFIGGMRPYEMRPAIGAGTRADATTTFDVRDVRFTVGPQAPPPRPPLHVEVFHHVLTDNATTAYTATADLPPAAWAFGRVLLTLDLHDAGKDWDEWDRNGEVSLVADDGTKLGLVPFITSYRTECHWVVDVTHFRPLLAGKRTFEIRAGTTFYKDRGYLMSVALDFHHGMPELAPYRVVPLWHGTARYQSDENHFQEFFSPQTVAIDAEAKAARIFVTTTGHSQVGEFTPSQREITFLPARGDEAAEPAQFENLLWKTDCYLNPNRPQYGTWQFSRAGWAPGDVVRPWWIDLTPHLRPGAEAELRYTSHPYEFAGEGRRPTAAQLAEATHVVRSYLILYRAPEGLVPAPTMMITAVEQGSAAAQATLQAGDYLATYDGRRIDSVDDLRAAIQGAVEARKERVKVVVVRGTTSVELEIARGRMGINLGSR